MKVYLDRIKDLKETGGMTRDEMEQNAQETLEQWRQEHDLPSWNLTFATMQHTSGNGSGETVANPGRQEKGHTRYNTSEQIIMVGWREVGTLPQTDKAGRTNDLLECFRYSSTN